MLKAVSLSVPPALYVCSILLYSFYFSLDYLNSMWVLLIYNSTASLQIKPNEVMEAGTRIFLPVSVAETKICKRFDTIPSGTLHPNADEIEYLQRLVMYKACSQLRHRLFLVMLFGCITE